MNKNSQKIVASIEARMTSTRLPGKVLLNAVGNISMLEYMIERLKGSNKIDLIVVATTTNSSDNQIVDLCKKINIDYYRGSENDVLDRVYQTHKYTSSDIVVELTGDCPLIDPKIIDQSIDIYLNNDFDYVSNAHVRSYPDGLDTQVFSFKLLEEINKRAIIDYDRENVSSFIYRNDKKYGYKLKALIAQGNDFWPELRITLDDKGDYFLINKIINYFHPKVGFEYGCGEIIDYLKENKQLLSLIKNSRATINPYQTISKLSE